MRGLSLDVAFALRPVHAICFHLPLLSFVIAMRWRPLGVGESFRPDDRGAGTEGYAITLRLKNHRHCNCLRSEPVVYVAEHHPSFGVWPMHYTASGFSASQFLFNNPSLEEWKPEPLVPETHALDPTLQRMESRVVQGLV